MTRRVLAGVFGAILFGVLTPILTALLIDAPDTVMGFIWLAVIGVAAGAVLGACFPRVFGFVVEIFFDV